MFGERARSRAAVAIVIASIACAEKPTAPDIVVTRLEAASSTSISGIAGAEVAERPSVLVRDQNGSPVQGFIVRFRIAYGNGQLGGGDAVTNTNGIATVGQWNLGRAVGPNRLIATHGLLALDFNATGVAGPPAVVAKVSGDNQYVLPSSLIEGVVISVRDLFDNPVSGALVTLSLEGGGSLSGARSVMSDQNGLARVEGWIAGEAGQQSLRVSVEGAPPVVFVAVATTDECLALREFTLGVPATFVLNNATCRLADGRRAISFALHVQDHVYEVRQSSPSFDSHLMVRTRNGDPVAEADGEASTGIATLTALLAPGEYILTATSRNAADEGAFTLSSNVLFNPLAGCREVFVVRAVSTNQTIGPADCAGDEVGSGEDRYRVYLKAGTTVSITMASLYIDTKVEIYGPENDLLAVAEENISYTSLDTRIDFKVPKSGYYRIKAIGRYISGPYTMIIN